MPLVMGHDNIDKEVKKKLEGRLLEPSSMAWDKLEGLLDEADKEKKKPFPVYWIAASLVLLLGVFWVLKNQVNEVFPNPTQEIVKQDDKIEGSKEFKDVEENSVVKVELNKEKIIKELAENKPIVVKKTNNKQKLKQYLKEENKELPTVYDITVEPIKEEQNSLVAVSTNDHGLDFEVDSLLADAMANLDKSKMPKEITKPKEAYKVDADALLADVEEELDLSFKEKVFKKIKQGFKKTKMAVAKRND